MPQKREILTHPLATDLTIGGLLVAALVAVFVGPGALAGPLVVVSLTIPGYALIRLIRLHDRAMAFLLGTAISASLLGITALAQLTIGAWDPRASVSALLLVGLTAVHLNLANKIRARDVEGAGAPPAPRAREVAPTASAVERKGVTDANAVAGTAAAEPPEGRPKASKRETTAEPSKAGIGHRSARAPSSEPQN